MVTTKAERAWAKLVARNLTLPGVEPSKAPIPQRDLPPQRPCDIGLFGDDAAQLDLIDRMRCGPR